MPYLSEPFTHDLFVSYAHADPKRTGKSMLKRWSERLAEELIAHIHALKTEFDMLDVFIDRDLDPTVELTPTLREEVSRAGLLLLIMSPHYLRSAWCGDELAWFEGEVRRRAKSKGCILVVRAVPTQEEKWPECLKDERGHTVLGFWFHARPVAEMTHPFGWPDPQPQDRQFYEELGKLATVVVRRLRELKELQALEQEALKPAPSKQIKGSPCIYLQAPTDDESAWLSTKRLLEEAGYRVKPERLARVTKDLGAMQQERRQRIADLRAAHSLLFLRASPNETSEVEIKAAVDDRADLQAFFGKELPCAVLDRVGGELTIADALKFQRIDGRDRGWLLHLQGWLATALGASIEVGA